MTPHDLVQLGAFCSARLAEVGMTLELSRDFKAIQGLAGKIKKPYFTKELSHAFNDFTPQNGFWMIMRDKDNGKPVGVLGARMDDLRATDVLSFMLDQATRLHSPDETPAFQADHYPPVIDRMGGRIVYVGDFFVVDKHRGLEKFDKRALVFYVYICAAIQWDFDWLYAFIRRPHAEKGYIANYCATVSYPEARFWNAPPEARSDGEFFAAIDRADFAYLTKLFLKRPEAF
ncbi:MAG: hypothetical protein AAFN79_10995 [Pseudomonadota bacterium]